MVGKSVRNFRFSVCLLLFSVLLAMMSACGTERVGDVTTVSSGENENSSVSTRSVSGSTQEKTEMSTSYGIDKEGGRISEVSTTISSTASAVTDEWESALDDEIEELKRMDDGALTPTQRNAINMLNYMTVLTQDINDSKNSRLFLDTAYSSLINNTYPNAIDMKTQSQISDILDTLHQYRMISVKRERIQYIFEQNQAQLMSKAIPNPINVLTVVKSGENPLHVALSVINMVAESVGSYQSSLNQLNLQFLNDGWELDDAEAEEVHKSRKGAFDYMIQMVRDNAIPGDFALNEEAVKNFVEWKNKTNLVRKIAWLESNESTYREFGPYWLELAKNYFDSKDYEKCLHAFEKYENAATRIFRKDTDYARALPMAITASEQIFSPMKYVERADHYASMILSNTHDKDWMLRYFVSQVYLDLYRITRNTKYLNESYKIAFDNVNVLVDEQKKLNETYLSDVKEAKIEDGANRRQVEETKRYNKMLYEERKVALPPVNEALYLNCELLFALAKERNISEDEKQRIESVLHEEGNAIFLVGAVDDRFRFKQLGIAYRPDMYDVNFEGGVLRIPACCVFDRSMCQVIVSGGNGETTFDDWKVEKVERPKEGDYSNFVAVLTSENARSHSFTDGDSIEIRIIPDSKYRDDVIQFQYKAVGVKNLFFFNGIQFERVK